MRISRKLYNLHLYLIHTGIVAVETAQGIQSDRTTVGSCLKAGKSTQHVHFSQKYSTKNSTAESRYVVSANTTFIYTCTAIRGTQGDSLHMGPD